LQRWCDQRGVDLQDFREIVVSHSTESSRNTSIIENLRISMGLYEFLLGALNLNCTGQGSPTVILDSGLGGLALSRQRVQREIEKFTRVCTYDRGGYGWGDPGPMPRTSAQIVKEFHTLLQNSGERPPYILVGHSSGGFNVRVYNGQYPDDVAGMVLVDASHEDQVRESPANIRKWWENSSKEFQRQMEFRALVIWLGVVRFASRNQTQEFAHLDLQPKFVYAMRSESENFEESAEEARSAGALGDKPLIVLTAGKDMSRLPRRPSQRRAFNVSFLSPRTRSADIEIFSYRSKPAGNWSGGKLSESFGFADRYPDSPDRR
jgi:pimeloyl-ACP methyl ester carboxylesterase